MRINNYAYLALCIVRRRNDAKSELTWESYVNTSTHTTYSYIAWLYIW